MAQNPQQQTEAAAEAPKKRGRPKKNPEAQAAAPTSPAQQMQFPQQQMQQAAPQPQIPMMSPPAQAMQPMQFNNPPMQTAMNVSAPTGNAKLEAQISELNNMVRSVLELVGQLVYAAKLNDMAQSMIARQFFNNISRDIKTSKPSIIDVFMEAGIPVPPTR